MKVKRTGRFPDSRTSVPAKAHSLLTKCLTISYPYSRTDDIPCQKKSEISKNCKAPIHAKCGFHNVSQTLFSSGTCIVDSTCSCPQKIISVSTILTWPPAWTKNTQNIPKCRMSNHGVRWHPWSTIILWQPECEKQSICVAPWHLPNGPYTIQNSFHIPEKFHTWPRRPCWSAWKNRKTSVSSKEPDLHGTHARETPKRFQVGTPSSPYPVNTWFQTILA